MPAPSAILVFICKSSGEYLTRERDDWVFTADPARAHQFEYHADDIPWRLQQMRRKTGIRWTAVPVDPDLRIETCDICGATMAPYQACFDGRGCLCLSCCSQSRSESAA